MGDLELSKYWGASNPTVWLLWIYVYVATKGLGACPAGVFAPMESRCFVGEAPGFWDRDSFQWQLHPTPRCPEPLRRFVSVRANCLERHRGSLIDCIRLHEGLASLANESVLMVGDSTSAQLADHSCQAFGAPTRSFVAVPSRLPNRSIYSHRLRSLDNHYCRLLRGSSWAKGGDREQATAKGNANTAELGLPLGTFSHYGVDGPPYWSYAYPLAPWLGKTSVAQARGNNC